MSSCFRPRRFRVILRPSTSYFPHIHRSFSSTCRVRQEEPSESTLDEREEEEEPHYQEWLDDEGQQWKHPDPLGPKWFGRSVPFPRNQTFKPPTPISDALRTTIYTSYVTNPETNSVHILSTRYGIAIKRIEAIVRLKDLEEQWKKSKPLQTGFLKGMERLLGLHTGGHATPIADEIDPLTREDVNAADEVSRQATEEGRDQKSGISRTFFEPVDEGQPPLVPGLLDEMRGEARASRAQRPEYPTKIVHPDPLRPAYKFVDVGLRWVDRADLERRTKESLRRKTIKDRKASDRQARAQAD